MSTAGPDKPAIAILPFERLDAEGTYPFLGDAIAEEVITTLSRVAELRVIARGSSFQYREATPDVRTVAGELGVRYVLQGSVRAAAGRVRVTAHLSDSMTGDEMWSERYDGDLSDVFAVQGDIAREIATALEVRVGYGEHVRVWHQQGERDLRAYEHFSRAYDHYMKFKRGNNLRARQEARKAVDIDPDFASAWVALAGTYATAVHLGWAEDRDAALRTARELVQKAFDIEPDFPEANALLGRIHMLEGDYDTAIEITGRALEQAPSFALGHQLQAMNFQHAGRYAEGVAAARMVFELSPLSESTADNARVTLAVCLAHLERYEEGLDVVDRAVEHRPEWLSARLVRTSILVGMGRLQDARIEAKRVLRIKPDFSTRWWGTIMPYRDQGVIDDINSSLERAGLPREPHEHDLGEATTGGPAGGRSLATVLFTDIVGSTRLAVEQGDGAWRATLDSHDAACDAIVGEHHGRMVKSTGDGIHALFDRPSDAVECARDLVAACSGLGLRLRIGVHTGEVEVRERDVDGIAVHIAARVATEARPDQILVTRTVRDLTAGGGLTTTPVGTVELRGIDGGQELFEVS